MIWLISCPHFLFKPPPVVPCMNHFTGMCFYVIDVPLYYHHKPWKIPSPYTPFFLLVAQQFTQLFTQRKSFFTKPYSYRYISILRTYLNQDNVGATAFIQGRCITNKTCPTTTCLLQYLPENNICYFHVFLNRVLFFGYSYLYK